MNKTSIVNVFLSGLILITFGSCSDDDVPPAENSEEVITRVTATFTNQADPSDVVTAIWLDADGEGNDAPVIDDVVLSANTSYTLGLEFENTLEDPAEDITIEIEEEAAEHMLFFGFTNALFSDPDGDGNLDNRSDAVNYEDLDANGLPVGLQTSWTTGDASSGTLDIVLKHQPDIKSATSDVNDGETDVEITFPVEIE